MLQRDPLLGRIDVASHHHALEDQTFVLRCQRIEHDQAAAEGKDPVAAGLRRCAKLGPQGVAGGSRGDLEWHAQRSPGDIPVQPEFGPADWNLMFGFVRVSDRAALRQYRTGDGLWHAIRRDIGINRGRHQRVGTNPGFGHAQGEQVIEDDLARLQLKTPMPLRRGRQRRAHRPGPLLAFRQHGEGYAAALGAVQVEADLRELPLIPAAAVIDGQTSVGDADFVQHPAVEAAGAGIKSEFAKLIDPGQQGSDIGCGTAFGQSLQRQNARIVLRRFGGGSLARRRLARGSLAWNLAWRARLRLRLW